MSKKCPKCGSTDLWDDNLAYGCNACGALLGGNDLVGFGPMTPPVIPPKRKDPDYEDDRDGEWWP